MLFVITNLYMSRVNENILNIVRYLTYDNLTALDTELK